MSPVMPAPASFGYGGGYGGYGYDPCNACAPPMAFNPCAVCAQPVAVMQPVTQTVYRDVPVTKYRPVEKTVQRPVMKWVNEQRPVTAYRQVVETKTVEVPSTAYQTVTECQQRCVNNSRWQTTYQRVPKMAPCQYDPNPTLLGFLNRSAYATRMAITPNYMRQRQYVPNVAMYNVPVTRTVAIPTSRTVAYNVARLEPYETTQTVAVAKVEYEDVKVTAMEPYTETVRMAVGATTTYAYVDPLTGGTTATALGPVPDQTIQQRTAANPTPAAGGANPPAANPPAGGLFNPLSYPQPRATEPAPQPTPSYFDAHNRQPAPNSPVAADLTRLASHSSGWRARRTPDAAPATVPEPHATARPVETQVAAVRP